jgi:hypothetical protein
MPWCRYCTCKDIHTNTEKWTWFFSYMNSSVLSICENIHFYKVCEMHLMACVFFFPFMNQFVYFFELFVFMVWHKWCSMKNAAIIVTVLKLALIKSQSISFASIFFFCPSLIIIWITVFCPGGPDLTHPTRKLTLAEPHQRLRSVILLVRTPCKTRVGNDMTKKTCIQYLEVL